MTAQLPALASALVVVSFALSWVRPVSLLGNARPRSPIPAPERAVTLASWCPDWFRAAARRADLPVPVERWWCAAVAGVVTAGVAALLVGGPVLAALVVGGASGGAVAALRAARNRLDERLAREVPDSLDRIARSTRAGSSVVQALAALDGPRSSDSDRLFASVAAQVDRGDALATALHRLLDRHQVHAVRLAVAALLVGNETGAAPARAVEGVATTLRDRAALDREAVANSSQARASVAVLVLAPVAFSVFAVATDPRVADFLFRSPIGWLCVGLGIGLDLVGAWWMRRIMVAAR